MGKIFVAIVVLALYFFLMKPNQVRNACAEQARKEAVMEVTEDLVPDDAERSDIQEDYEELAYKECLEEAGLSE